MTRMEEGQTKGMDEPGSSAPSGPPKSEEGIEAICAFPQNTWDHYLGDGRRQY